MYIKDHVAEYRSRNPTTVASGFVKGLLSGLPQASLTAEVALNRAEIAKERVADTEGRIPVARYAALYRIVSQGLDDEGFALFSRPLRPGSFEFLCRGALSAPSLDGGLDRCTRFLRLVLDDMDVSVLSDGHSARLIITEKQALPCNATGRIFAYEWLLRLLHGLAAWLVAHPLPLDEVHFPYPEPRHAPDYALVFAPQCTFNAPRLEARFPAEWLSLPVRRDEAALKVFLEGAPASITTLYRRDRSTTLRVRQLLRASPSVPYALPDVARRLFLSPRTLHRRLEEEGTGFNAIKEALRRELAIEWLTKTSRPLQTIATDLGYADAGSFFRAFSGWTGSGPREYRRRFGGL